MKAFSFFVQQNDAVKERYELCKGRIKDILTEDTVPELYKEYFKRYAEFIVFIDTVAESVADGSLYKKSLEELQAENMRLYEDILPDQYDKSYANPEYAVNCFGKKIGQALTVLVSEIRSLISCAYEYRLMDITIVSELFISIYNLFEEFHADTTYKEMKELMYYYVHDYCEEYISLRVKENINPDYSFARDLIMKSDLNDLRYLYYFGEYMTANELETAKHLNQMSDADVQKMADTYVDGYVRGFVTMGADLSKKSIIQVRYCIGFERMLRYAIQKFEDMGKRVTVGKVMTNLVNRSAATRKIGYHGSGANLQYEYDHRFDNALILNKKMTDRMYRAWKSAYEMHKELYAVYAGPAVLETFGEENPVPYVKAHSLSRNKRQQQLILNLTSSLAELSTQYIKEEEISFTIIAYPLPSIGKAYQEIFDETVKLNNLDNEVYKEIQQSIIDALDLGKYCHILGADGNKTNLKVMLHALNNPEKETNFENCTADVNIPVGEVFTSPVLKGTEGILHVSEIYINGLPFKDLMITFKDGMTESYTCGNFEEVKENEKFVKENILKDHDSLPMGEFAIGTNTIAYVMAAKYNIQEKLPILIAEKTGPHFAVGDTCYSKSEDHKVYNPDGKEIIARENECSALRHTDMSRAYFNCHTDITIPYHEIKEISVYQEDGNKTDIIKDKRFVLKGTEKLNEAFDE